jgi:hypothetical protein
VVRADYGSAYVEDNNEGTRRLAAHFASQGQGPAPTMSQAVFVALRPLRGQGPRLDAEGDGLRCPI